MLKPSTLAHTMLRSCASVQRVEQVALFERANDQLAVRQAMRPEVEHQTLKPARQRHRVHQIIVYSSAGRGTDHRPRGPAGAGIHQPLSRSPSLGKRTGS